MSKKKSQQKKSQMLTDASSKGDQQRKEKVITDKTKGTVIPDVEVRPLLRQRKRSGGVV